MTDKKTMRCTTCRSEFSDVEVEGHSSCPNCKSVGVPMSIEQDVTIKINLHELRILTIWADNWARQECNEDSVAALNGIVNALREQHPGVALTMSDEYQELADATGKNVTVHEAGEKKTIEPVGNN